MNSNFCLTKEDAQELAQILSQITHQDEKNNCPICGQHKLWKYGHEKDCPLEKWQKILAPREKE